MLKMRMIYKIPDKPKELRVGDRFMYMGDEARVMAITEGYVMARKKGCYPFLVPLKEVAAHQAEISE